VWHDDGYKMATWFQGPAAGQSFCASRYTKRIGWTGLTALITTLPMPSSIFPIRSAANYPAL